MDPEATQNMIPVDNVVAYLMKMLKRKDLPVILNFAGRKTVKNSELARIVNKVLPVEVIQQKDLEKKDLNRLEKMVASFMSFTGNYANANLEFDTKNLEKAVSPNGNEVTPESLHKMVAYFVDEQAERNRKAKKPLL